MTFWWISFADDSGFLGAAIVEGDDFPAAIIEAHRQGVNPGGEAKGIPLVKAKSANNLLPFAPNRLYSKADIDNIDKAEKF